MFLPRSSIRTPQNPPSTTKTRLFAPHTSCSCNEEASSAWKHISAMTRVPFDVIITASAQAIEFSVQSQDCASCASASTDGGVMIETLMQLYTRLVDLLEAATVTYTSGEECVSVKTADLARYRSDSVEVVGRMKPGVEVVCLPSIMILGEYTLDEQQSRQLALDVVGRTLRNLGAVLQQMPREGGRVDVLFSRVMRLLSLSTASS